MANNINIQPISVQKLEMDRKFKAVISRADDLKYDLVSTNDVRRELGNAFVVYAQALADIKKKNEESKRLFMDLERSIN